MMTISREGLDTMMFLVTKVMILSTVMTVMILSTVVKEMIRLMADWGMIC